MISRYSAPWRPSIVKWLTFARILIAKYFFHSPWQLKWLQLGALHYVKLLIYLLSCWRAKPSEAQYLLYCLFVFTVWPWQYITISKTGGDIIVLSTNFCRELSVIILCFSLYLFRIVYG